MQRFDEYRDLLRFNYDHPQTVELGAAYRPTPRWTVALDYKYVDWSGVAQSGKTTIRGGLGWRDQHIVKLGAAYELNERWTLRGGVAYGKSPIPREQVFSNVVFPGNTELHLGLGASYRIAPRHEIHVAYQHAFEKELTDNGQGDLFSLGGGGTSTTLEEDSLVVQYTYRF